VQYSLNKVSVLIFKELFQERDACLSKNHQTDPLMTGPQNLAIALLQGVTELFPVSSLGHAIIVPALLGWQSDPAQLAALPFLVMLHFGTTIALLAFFWRDWKTLLSHVLGYGDPTLVRRERHVAQLLVIATLPAVVIGAVAEHALRKIFAAPIAVAFFLIANGLLLLVCDALRRRHVGGEARDLASLSVLDAVLIGFSQCLAFFPGISRSGSTISVGLLRGLTHESAARFSFLLAPLIISAATALQLFKLRHAPGGLGGLTEVWLPGVVAGVTAFASTALLMRWFRQHEDWALWPFAVYCVVMGGISVAFLI